MEITGSCLCKRITFKIRGPFSRFALCYCTRCQKVTGSAHAFNLFADADLIEWLGGENEITRYELPEAERFSRAFCSACGTPVPCLSRDKKRVVIPAGCLDREPAMGPTARIYHRFRPAWYEKIDATPVFDGLPV